MTRDHLPCISFQFFPRWWWRSAFLPIVDEEGLLSVHRQRSRCPSQSSDSLQAGTIQEVIQQFSFFCILFLNVNSFGVVEFIVMYQATAIADVFWSPSLKNVVD
jgi:hypothetical protein